MSTRIVLSAATTLIAVLLCGCPADPLAPTPPGEPGSSAGLDPASLALGDDSLLAKEFPQRDRELILNGEEVLLHAIVCEREAKPDEKTLGQQYPITGTKALGEPQRIELVEALSAAIKEGIEDGVVAECFEPHHGVVARRGEDVVEYVICFKCLQFNRRVSPSLLEGEVQPVNDKAPGKDGLVRVQGGVIARSGAGPLNSLLD